MVARARYYALSAYELALDVAALNMDVVILGVLGRNSGSPRLPPWPRMSGVIGEAFVYAPKVGFKQVRFLDQVERRWNQLPGFVIAVGEGLVDEEGPSIVSTPDTTGADSIGGAFAGNVSHYPAEPTAAELGIRARSEKPGLIERSSSYHVAAVDRQEAMEARDICSSKRSCHKATGGMVSIRRQCSLT